jgi:hydroxymethylbilane synthase
MRHIRIGSRGSDLALWQANHVKKQLIALGCNVEIIVITTKGDDIQDLSFDKLEGKGFFTKEIEQALINNEIDLAVHSHKDLETQQPEGLVIAAVSERADPSDLLLIRREKVDKKFLLELSENGILGTSSARRKSQVRSFRPDVHIKDLRGNVPTRIQKLRNGDYDAILLAKAGVDRLQINLSEFHVHVLDPLEFIPAPAQGVLALQIRKDDASLLEKVRTLNHPDVQKRITVERRVLNLLQGGCQLPLGVFCGEEDIVHVSYCHKWEEGANRYTYCSDDLETLPSIIVEELLA